MVRPVAAAGDGMPEVALAGWAGMSLPDSPWGCPVDATDGAPSGWYRNEPRRVAALRLDPLLPFRGAGTHKKSGDGFHGGLTVGDEAMIAVVRAMATNPAAR